MSQLTKDVVKFLTREQLFDYCKEQMEERNEELEALHARQDEIIREQDFYNQMLDLINGRQTKKTRPHATD